MKEIGESNASKIVKNISKLPFIAGIIWDLSRIYFLKPIDVEALRGTVRSSIFYSNKLNFF
ncbi:MAG: hypothetical protein ACQZ3M_05775 [cyanobacterium endosymbiont of Rhopalodia fuxianensis]